MDFSWLPLSFYITFIYGIQPVLLQSFGLALGLGFLIVILCLRGNYKDPQLMSYGFLTGAVFLVPVQSFQMIRLAYSFEDLKFLSSWGVIVGLSLFFTCPYLLLGWMFRRSS